MKKLNLIFYLTISLFTVLCGLSILHVHLNIFPRFPFFLVVCFCFYFLSPLAVLSFLILFISYIKEYKFRALKEISLNIYAISISIGILYFLNEYSIFSNNKMEISVSNLTDEILHPVRIEGRNALNELDSILPNETRKIIFRGKEIDYKTKNDYNNEIALHYYSTKDKWVHHKILRGLIGQYSVISGNWNIKIFSKDSIIVETILLEK